MTPLHIQILLHHHCTPTPFPQAGSPAGKSFTKELVDRGLLTLDAKKPDRIRTTNKGKALVSMLCKTPDPVEAWFDPRTKETYYV